MRSFILSLIVSIVILLVPTKPLRAYDTDCAIMLCMAGGFPSSAVCAAAYAEMIRRITPWPVRPPFGVCTYAAIPVELGGPGGEGELDITIPEYAWLRKTRVYWFRGSSDREDGDTFWSWSIRSCDHENRRCRYQERVFGSRKPWPGNFLSENSQTLRYPPVGSHRVVRRAVMMEFGDYEGNMGHSDWVHY